MIARSGLATGARNAYLTIMAESPEKPAAWRMIALVATPLGAILAGAGWYAVHAWESVAGGPAMPATGYVAMTLGVVFSLVVGCGLMALLFYSNRHGYDEPYRGDDDHSN